MSAEMTGRARLAAAGIVIACAAVSAASPAVAAVRAPLATSSVEHTLISPMADAPADETLRSANYADFAGAHVYAFVSAARPSWIDHGSACPICAQEPNRIDHGSETCAGHESSPTLAV
jgi:hypothetical protein